jgi:hypothetical protein
MSFMDYDNSQILALSIVTPEITIGFVVPTATARPGLWKKILNQIIMHAAAARLELTFRTVCRTAGVIRYIPLIRLESTYNIFEDSPTSDDDHRIL